MDNIVEKIRKLLQMTQANGASENEAMTAALKAQKLMAENNLTVADIETDRESEEIAETKCNCGDGEKWKYYLSDIVARNFCCKTYSVGARWMVFYGYKRDTEIAKSVFEFLFKTGKRLGDKVYNEYYERYGSARGVRNSYLAGFCTGINEVLGKQCVALMLVTPKKVEDTFNEMSANFGTINSSLKITRSGATAYENGVVDGRAVANSRSIEG